jgi:hypothetical protein
MSSTTEDILALCGGIGLIAVFLGGWVIKWILIFTLGFLAYQTNPKLTLIILGVLVVMGIILAAINAFLQWAKNK